MYMLMGYQNSRMFTWSGMLNYTCKEETCQITQAKDTKQVFV